MRWSSILRVRAEVVVVMAGTLLGDEPIHVELVVVVVGHVVGKKLNLPNPRLLLSPAHIVLLDPLELLVELLVVPIVPHPLWRVVEVLFQVHFNLFQFENLNRY